MTDTELILWQAKKIADLETALERERTDKDYWFRSYSALAKQLDAVDATKNSGGGCE